MKILFYLGLFSIILNHFSQIIQCQCKLFSAPSFGLALKSLVPVEDVVHIMLVGYRLLRVQERVLHPGTEME